MIEIAKQRAEIWLNNSDFDFETCNQVRSLLQDEQALLAAFGNELAFGTGGLRGILGVGTGRMNEYVIARATQGLADYLETISGKCVAIAYDSRLCSDTFAKAAACVLAENGLIAYIYPELMPTPMLSFAVRYLHCDAGIVVTASHNPAQYNGYKVYGADGCQITEEAAANITACIEKIAYGTARQMDEKVARQKGLIKDIDQTVFDAFIAKTLSCRVAPQVDAQLLVVYTPLHGTGLKPVHAVLDRMKGITCIDVIKQCVPDGHFPTCPKPNPELSEALELGLELAAEVSADLLIATDPDSDRVGVAIREGNGRYKVLTGNEVGLLLMRFILETRRENGTLPENPVVVKTIVTSDLAFTIAKDYGVTIVECLTGFKYIGEIIGRLEQAGEEGRYVFGFEESCGYLAGTHVRDKDAVMTCMLVAEMAQYYLGSGKSLAQVLNELYARYGYMGTRLLSYDIAGVMPMEKMTQVMREMRENSVQMLDGSEVTWKKDYFLGIDGLPKSNALSFATADGKKVIVRPSGTEPKIKVYLSARAASQQEATRMLDDMEKDMNSRIQ